MLFQTLDDKSECFGIYCNGELHFDMFPEGADKTWSYSSYLSDSNIEYAQVYCGGLSLQEACPPELRLEWESVSRKGRAFLKSFATAKLSLREHCFYDLVPQRYLSDICEVKNKICEHVFQNYDRPKNYDFIVNALSLTSDISNRELRIEKSFLRDHLSNIRARNLWKNIDTIGKSVKYNVYGTKTGRLSTLKDSFPILTLNKEFRGIIQPTNDWFVELDFNAAELRTLLALSGSPQPDNDIHEWNVQNVYGGDVSRDEAKQKIFAWLYNPDAKDTASSTVYKTKDVLRQHWDGVSVMTPFDRTIKADRRHALNYLIQSTSSDVFLDRAFAISKALEKRKSFISMLIHDSVVLDLASEDMKILKNIVDIFSNTRYGKYKVGVNVGKSFGNMRRVR